MIRRFKTMLGVAASLLVAQPVLAADPIKFGLCYDLTKVYAFAMPQTVQAARDLADVINLKGGIEGRPIELILQEHGNEPQRGVECYERLKAQGAIAFDMSSTGVGNAVLPRAMNEGVVLIQVGLGRSDAVDGEVFKWVFPLGSTYWGMVGNIVSYAKKQSGGSLKGKKIAFLYIDFPFGQEPLPVLQELQKTEGFELQLFPYPLPGNDQTSAWSQMRRYQPDYVIHWGTASMHVVAAKEAQRNGVPIDKVITTPWISDVDIGNIGNDAAKGLKKVSTFAGGADLPIIREIQRELYDKSKGNGDPKWIGTTYYNRGLASFLPVFEGARLAAKQEGHPLTSDKLRKGLESVRNFDGDGVLPPMNITEKDHGSGGKSRIEMWDGTKWVPQTDWSAEYSDLVWSIVKTHSTAYSKAK